MGFAKRAGKVSSGMNKVKSVIQSGKAKLVIVSKDAALNTKEKLKALSSLKGIPYIEVSSNEELSKITGEENKGTYAILDKEFSEAIIKITDSI